MALRGAVLASFIFVLAGLWTAPATAQSSRPAEAAGAEAAGDQAGIGRRIQRLEEQLIDLQSQTAALESMGNSGSAPAAGGFGGDSGDLSGRLANLEVQMQALTGQISDVMQRLQQMERQLGVTPSRGALPPTSAPSQFAGRDVGGAQSGRPSQGADMRRADQGGNGFGSTAIEPYDRGSGDRSSGYSRQESSDRYANAPTALPPLGNSLGNDGGRGDDPYAPQPARISSPEARALYDQAYSSLVKREYQAAETYFQEFLRQYPSDPLAGPAQFWLGESAFVAGEYRRAADNFLKSYSNFPNSDKAPESLLKLGISLKRLGNTNEACASFAELQQKFPQAQSVLQRAEAEKRRANC